VLVQAPKRNGSKAAVGRKLPISDAGQSALHCAAQNGHVDVVNVLLSTENVDVTLTDSCGRTALHCAAQNGHADVVQCLLKDKRFGSRMVNKVDSSGDSALLLAICGKYVSIQLYTHHNQDCWSLHTLEPELQVLSLQTYNKIACASLQTHSAPIQVQQAPGL